MKVNSIDLDGDDLPKSVTVTMSVEEAALIAKIMGRMRYSSSLTSSIYNGLGVVFNQFYDSGYDGVYLAEDAAIRKMNLTLNVEDLP